ncbi:uncharacterized protein LOC144318895 isoform X2 [Canis aureus]
MSVTGRKVDYKPFTEESQGEGIINYQAPTGKENPHPRSISETAAATSPSRLSIPEARSEADPPPRPRLQLQGAPSRCPRRAFGSLIPGLLSAARGEETNAQKILATGQKLNSWNRSLYILGLLHIDHSGASLS